MEEIEKEILNAQKEIKERKKIQYHLFKKFQKILLRILLKISLVTNLMKAVLKQLGDVQKKTLAKSYDSRCNFLGNCFFFIF